MKGRLPILAIAAAVIALCLVAIFIQILNSRRSGEPPPTLPPGVPVHPKH